MIHGVKGSLLAAVSLALVGCAATGGEAKSASDKPATAEKPAKFNKDPYPSTYRPYGGRPTAVRGVTIFDGEGGRIDNGVVLFAGGKVEAVGGADMAIPADYDVIDGTGKFVTQA